jgi:putative spermidine/putrescine transport system permease protein
LATTTLAPATAAASDARDGRGEALRAADGTPLKRKLERTTRLSRLRAFLLVVPLLAFVVVSFLVPVGTLLWRGVSSPTFATHMPRTTAVLAEWDGRAVPGEAAFAALAADLVDARESRDIGKVATRVNRELSGTRSLFTRSARRAERIDEGPFRAAIIDIDEDWGELELWRAMKVASWSVTPAFYLQALDLQVEADGAIARLPEERQLHVSLFWRTLWMSGLITFLCLLLGFPVAYLLANLPLKYSNLLMIFVLLPFWTSLLVRTTSWIALLQSQGVLNDVFVALGLAADDRRLQLIYNQAGTIIAMTHILLPFMILPLYSVMKTIPPSYLRAARSLGADQVTAFRRVYLPQTVPGIGAGSLLVFILAVGYYITPALVGGQSGQLISNIIAFHMESTLNWNLAAALGGILLVGVVLLYWTYNRLIGIDNIKLG